MTEDNHNGLELDSLIRGQSKNSIPPDVEQRLRARLDVFRDCMESSASIHKLSGAEPKHRKRAVWISAAVLAACASIVVFVFLNLTRTHVWADVVESVQKQPWIQCIGVRPDGVRMEIWFSSSKPRRTFAGRFGNLDFAWHVDFAQREEFRYRKRDGTIVRRPLQKINEPDLGIAGDFLSVFAPHDELLKQINEDSVLIERSRKEVTKDGRVWIQYQLIFEETHGQRERHIDTFLIDVNTNLPRWWIRSSPDGKTSLRFRIEYPNSGPNDIFDLGVPRSTPVVDHVAE